MAAAFGLSSFLLSLFAAVVVAWKAAAVVETVVVTAAVAVVETVVVATKVLVVVTATALVVAYNYKSPLA